MLPFQVIDDDDITAAAETLYGCLRRYVFWTKCVNVGGDYVVIYVIKHAALFITLMSTNLILLWCFMQTGFIVVCFHCVVLGSEYFS